MLRWLTGIGAAFRKLTISLSRPKPAASDITAETHTAGVATTSLAPATLTAAGTNIGLSGQGSDVAPVSPDPQEIQRCLTISGATATTSRRRSWID